MDFSPTPNQAAMLERTQAVLDDYSTALVRDAEASADGLPTRLWESIVDLGLPGVSLPAQSGGKGEGLLSLCLLLEETGRAGATLPLVVGRAAAEMVHRSPEGSQRDRLLRAIAAGTIVAPVLIDENGRNEWDTPRLPLRADGDAFHLSGTKVLVPFASVAAELLVTAVTDRGEPAIVVVDPGSSGVSIIAHQAKAGVPVFSVVLENVRVTADQVLCEGDGATDLIARGLMVGSLLSTAEAVGFAEALIRRTAEFVTTRHAFGRPIGTFQAVSHPCANMRVSAEAIRILVHEAAWLLDNGRPVDEEIPAVKALANELFERVANDAYRLHGAQAFSNECDVQLFMHRLHGFFNRFGETQESFDRAAAAVGM